LSKKIKFIARAKTNHSCNKCSSRNSNNKTALLYQKIEGAVTFFAKTSFTYDTVPHYYKLHPQQSVPLME
jgi:hypothetical protein